MRHTVILSDIHLWEAVAGDGLWMRYRQRRFFPDASIAALLAKLIAEAADGDLELVLNGDIFDFDVPRADGHEENCRTEPAAAERIDRILDDHPLFLDALARLLLRGHRVVFVSGNHDVQLAFPAVRERIVRRIEAAAASRPVRAEAVQAVRVRVLFRAWFHRTVDGVHVEHGNQYDPYCVARYPQAPFIPGTREVQPTLSSLTMKHLIGRMGYFNPNVDRTFLLSFPGYLAHWARYYLFSRRSLVLAWALGTLRVAAALALGRVDDGVERALSNLLRTARETGAPLEALSEHGGLAARPELRRAARLLWLDRLALVALAALGAAMTALHRGAGLAVIAASVAGLALARALLPEGDLERIYQRILLAQREIARIHAARAVVFGHTHIAHGAWRDGVFFGNCGTWAPMFSDIACAAPLQRGCPFVWLRAGDDDVLEGGLYRFDDGVIAPDATAAREGDGRDRSTEAAA
jgi:UDP-2,3-diacylglucosamine pyrophosphatase LpxH